MSKDVEIPVSSFSSTVQAEARSHMVCARYACVVGKNIRPDGTHAMECSVFLPEDLILRKIEWYRAEAKSRNAI